MVITDPSLKENVPDGVAAVVGHVECRATSAEDAFGSEKIAIAPLASISADPVAAAGNEGDGAGGDVHQLHCVA